MTDIIRLLDQLKPSDIDNMSEEELDAILAILGIDVTPTIAYAKGTAGDDNPS
jgi:hypothetical protein